MSEAMGRRDVIGWAGAAGVTAAVAGLLGSSPALPIEPTGGGGPTLRERADRKGLLCGAAVRADLLASDDRLRRALRDNANILVPEVELKWASLQPVKGPPRFDRAEQIYAFAHRNDMKLRGHTLTWYREEPDWAKALVPTLSVAAAGDLLTGYVRDVVGHWRGRMAQWDVANEAIDGARKLTEPIFSAKLGETYLDLIYHAAHEADPHALLVFNTDLIEMDDPYQERHRTATLELLGRLLKRGVPVQALGIEGHISTMNNFSEGGYRRFLDEVTGMGLKLMITEFDVSDRGTLGTIAERDAAVAALGKAFLDVSFSYPQCGGMLTWAITDRYTWLRGERTMQRSDKAVLRPSMLDDDYARKPLWNAVAAAIDGAPHR